MTRQLTAWLLLLLVWSFGTKELTIYLGFKWNQEAIAKQLCVNLDEPQIMCSGKCFLGQQLIERTVQNDDGDQFPVVSLEIAKVYYTSPLNTWSLSLPDQNNSNLFFYHLPPSTAFGHALFRPPALG